MNVDKSISPSFYNNAGVLGHECSSFESDYVPDVKIFSQPLALSSKMDEKIPTGDHFLLKGSGNKMDIPLSSKYSKYQRGVSDEDVKTETSLKSKKEPDEVENFTLKMFVDLYELADRINRKDFQKAIGLSPKKRRYSISSNPLYSDASLLDDELIHNFNMKQAMSKIMDSITHCLFGWKINEKTTHEIGSILKDDWKNWNKFKVNYDLLFDEKIETIFKSADLLIKERVKNESFTSRVRMTFYCGVITAVAGKIFEYYLISCCATAVSLISFIFLIKVSSEISSKQKEYEHYLKKRLNEVYNSSAKEIKVNKGLSKGP